MEPFQLFIFWSWISLLGWCYINLWLHLVSAFKSWIHMDSCISACLHVYTFIYTVCIYNYVYIPWSFSICSENRLDPRHLPSQPLNPSRPTSQAFQKFFDLHSTTLQLANECKWQLRLAKENKGLPLIKVIRKLNGHWWKVVGGNPSYNPLW